MVASAPLRGRGPIGRGPIFRLRGLRANILQGPESLLLSRAAKALAILKCLQRVVAFASSHLPSRGGIKLTHEASAWMNFLSSFNDPHRTRRQLILSMLLNEKEAARGR